MSKGKVNFFEELFEGLNQDYSKQNISIDVNTKSDRENKQDEELMEEFLTLVKDLPEDRAKRVEDMIDNFSKQESKKH